MNDNAQSTTVKDSTVYGNGGTAQRNTADMHTTGVIDGALRFDGSTNYVDLSGLGCTLEVENISVSVWARSDSVAGPINWILGNAKQSRIGFGPGKMYFWIQEEGLGSINLISGGSVSAGNWYHIVGTYDGTYQKLCVNSLLVASEAPGLGDLDNGHDSFAIGQACASGGGYFNGDVDDVRIFSRALSASKVLALYDEGRHVAGPIGHWTLDDNTQSTADMHVMDLIAGALSFDGSTDYVDLSGLGSILEAKNISVSVWARSDSVTGPINWILISDNYSYRPRCLSYKCYYNQST